MIDSQQVTVELSLPLYLFLARPAEQTHQPLENRQPKASPVIRPYSSHPMNIFSEGDQEL